MEKSIHEFVLRLLWDWGKRVWRMLSSSQLLIKNIRTALLPLQDSAIKLALLARD